jgi:hypothetical protein
VRVVQADLQTQAGAITLVGMTGNPLGADGVLLDAGTAITKLAGSQAASLQVDSTGDISVAQGVRFTSLLGSLNVALNARPFNGGTVRPSGISIANLVQFLTGGGSITLYGNDNLAAGAAGSITFGSAALDTRPLTGAGPGGALTMRADSDGIRASNAQIQTQGGAVTLDGVDTTGSTTTGVTLAGTIVDAGTGAVTIRGAAGPAPSGTTGVSITGQFSGSTADITGGSVFIGGNASATSSSGDAVGVDLSLLKIAASSVGISGRGGAGRGQSIGAALRGADVATATGSIVVLGRATPSPVGSAGVSLDQHPNRVSTVLSAPGTGARISLAGSSEGGGANDRGIAIAGGTVGNATATTDIFLMALTSGGGEAISIGANGSIATRGNVNIRPGRVTLEGNAEDATSEPIRIGGVVADAGLLVPASLLNSIGGPPARVVIGSAAQTGQITVAGALDLGMDLTLQNSGTGSSGILINQRVTLRNNTFALVSGGHVTQSDAGAIQVARLALRGFTDGSGFDLPAAKNPLPNPEVPENQLVSGGPGSGRLAAYSEGGSVRFVARSQVDLSPVTWSGVAAGTDPWSSAESRSLWMSETIGALSQEQGPTVFHANGSFLVKAAGGNLVLDPDITTTTGDITLSTTGVFRNIGAPDPAGNTVPAQLLPGNNQRFQVIAKTWEQEVRNGLAGSGEFPNLYGCGSRDCTASGNAFIYTDRPNATVSFDSLTVAFGVPGTRSVDYHLSGLVNGDTPTAIFGTQGPDFSLTTLGIGQFPVPGKYTVNPSISSAAGYNVTVIPGDVFVVLQDPVPPAERNPPELQEATLPRVCTTTAPALTAYSTSPEGDYLDLDWSRSRERLSLTSCTGLRLRDACSDF